MESSVYALEGQSTSRPPLFNGSNFSYWKARMQIFLRCIDLNILDVVTSKYVEPTGRALTEPERHLAMLNVKAMNALHCGLTPNEFNRISTCTTAFEIWDKLYITHDGTPQVKESKISSLVHEYELFKMQKNESIDSMYIRFTNIINQLHSLDKVYEKQEMNYKILRSLTPIWEPKVTAVEEANDLTKLTIDGLIGKLKVHEKKIGERENEQALKEPSPKRKSIAFKGASDSEESEDSDLDIKKEIRHLGKRMENLVRMTKHCDSDNSNKSSNHVGRCYKCKRKGHFANKCPLRKEKKKDKVYPKKKKAMYVGWDESEPSDTSDDESTLIAVQDPNVCFMAQEDEVHSNSDSDSDSESPPSYDDVCDALNELNQGYQKLNKVHKSCDAKYKDLLSNMNNAIDLKERLFLILKLKRKIY